MRRLAILLAMLVLGGTACLGSSTAGTSVRSRPEPTTPTSGVLKGRVMTIGGPCICPRPLRNGVFELRSGGKVVATVRTDNHGRFTVDVPAGRYRLATAPTAPYPFRRRAVEVSADHTTRVRLRFAIF